MLFSGKKKYEDWIRTFFEGSLIVPGWNAVSRDVLEATPPERRDLIRERLAALGDKISREWAKENVTRRIDSTHLQRWGRILKSRQQQGYEILAAELETIEEEVERLLENTTV